MVYVPTCSRLTLHKVTSPTYRIAISFPTWLIFHILLPSYYCIGSPSGYSQKLRRQCVFCQALSKNIYALISVLRLSNYLRNLSWTNMYLLCRNVLVYKASGQIKVKKYWSLTHWLYRRTDRRSLAFLFLARLW